MKILLLMDPSIPVPPVFYGGIERVVYDLACEYAEMGHEVTLIAGPNSQSPGRLITFGENADTQSIKINFKLLFELTKILYVEVPKHDVIHNFGRLLWLYPIMWFKCRKVHTYMRYITPGNIKWLNRLGVRNVTYTAVSGAIVNTGIWGEEDGGLFTIVLLSTFSHSGNQFLKMPPWFFLDVWKGAREHTVQFKLLCLAIGH